MAYVPEDNLISPSPADKDVSVGTARHVRCLHSRALNLVLQKLNPSIADLQALQHPFIYLLFSGMGADGSYIPTRALRERYDVERRDIYPDEDVKDESNEQ